MCAWSTGEYLPFVLDSYKKAAGLDSIGLGFIHHKLYLSFSPKSRVPIDIDKTEEYTDNHLIISVYFICWFVLAMEFIKLGILHLGGWTKSGESELETWNEKSNENNSRGTQIQG